MTSTTMQEKNVAIVDPVELLAHWQGHRALTRRVIAAYPEKELFTHRIGGMRSFGEMIFELLAIAGPGMKEIAGGGTETLNEAPDKDKSKAAILKRWDEATDEINKYWSQLSPGRFRERIKAFGQYEGTVLSTIFYFIDNEIHHRGQGYVYLRSLGVEPPAFWERGGFGSAE